MSTMPCGVSCLPFCVSCVGGKYDFQLCGSSILWLKRGWAGTRARRLYVLSSTSSCVSERELSTKKSLSTFILIIHFLYSHHIINVLHISFSLLICITMYYVLTMFKLNTITI